VTIARIVVAHVDRARQANLLANQIGATVLFDDGTLGAGGNHRRALRHGVDVRASHILIVEDDALPIPTFTSAVSQAIRQRPDQILGLYVGKARPIAKRVTEAVEQADRTGASWLTYTGLLWGVATVWPRNLARAYLREPDPGPDWDTRSVTPWCRAHNITVAYTWPSLVDHGGDGGSVIRGRSRDAGRVAHRVGVPTWNGEAVPIL
jgi:hypothetical protein